MPKKDESLQQDPSTSQPPIAQSDAPQGEPPAPGPEPTPEVSDTPPTPPPSAPATEASAEEVKLRVLAEQAALRVQLGHAPTPEFRNLVEERLQTVDKFLAP